jgi:FtsP/CotA-like multicopper oxidase with cupredoxin domain
MFSIVASYAFVRDTAAGGGALTPAPPVANSCPRAAAGSVVHNPPALFSSDGVLNVTFSYEHGLDTDGNDLFCFMTPDGLQNPTLHVKPGDTLNITVTNNTPAQPLTMTLDPPNCGATQMGKSSVNIHYHGTNTSPSCHSDEVIKTIVNSGKLMWYWNVLPELTIVLITSSE